jgi:anaerobic dimethyl sulfoxide reductase subunit A
VNDFHNPLQGTEDINRGIKVFKKMDMVVDVHTRFTLTNQYADIILPCITPWEGNIDPEQGELNVGTTCLMRASVYQCNRDMIITSQPIIPPMYETRNETWIFSELAKRLGLDPKEVYPISDIQSYYDKLAGAEVVNDDGITYRKLVTITQKDIDAWGVEGKPQKGDVTLKELLDKGMYIVPRKPGDKLGYIGYKDFIDDPIANPRGSASGKLEIYCQAKADSINEIGYAKEKLKPYPTYHPSTYENSFEDWKNKKKGKYPFIMYQPHYLRRSHTIFDECVWTQEALQNPVFISTEDARRKGIKTGDTVLVFNGAGKLLRHASVTDLMVPGSMALPHGPRTYLDLKTGIDFGGNENMVVDADTQDEFFPHMNGYNSCLVDFVKYDGDPLPADCTREPVLWTEA